MSTNNDNFRKTTFFMVLNVAPQIQSTISGQSLCQKSVMHMTEIFFSGLQTCPAWHRLANGKLVIGKTPMTLAPKWAYQPLVRTCTANLSSPEQACKLRPPCCVHHFYPAFLQLEDYFAPWCLFISNEYVRILILSLISLMTPVPFRVDEINK